LDRETVSTYANILNCVVLRFLTTYMELLIGLIRGKLWHWDLLYRIS